MRLATWNVNSLNARMPRVTDWLERVRPDVLCMQETKLANDAFPADEFAALGYESVHHGQGQWNGVAILSRVGLEDSAVDFDDGGDADVDARIVWATCGGVRVASVYVPNGREVDHDHYHYKLDWLSRLGTTIDNTTALGAGKGSHDKVVIAGDYNIAPEDRDVWDTAAFEGATHVTDRERAALTALVDRGLTDVFRQEHPEIDGLYSYWDYTAGRFHKREGIRIDLVLASSTVAEATARVVVDRNARKGTKPSDHTPVVADFNLT